MGHSALMVIVYLTIAGAPKVLAMQQAKTVTVTDKDHDKTVTLAPQDLLIVRLEAPLGDGHVWKITRNNPEQLKPLDRPPVDRLGKSPPSKVELHVYYLKAQMAGQSDLELEYRRPADKDAKPAKTFKVRVNIEK